MLPAVGTSYSEAGVRAVAGDWRQSKSTCGQNWGTEGSREEVGGAHRSSSIQANIHLKTMPSRLCIRKNNLSHEDPHLPRPTVSG